MRKLLLTVVSVVVGLAVSGCGAEDPSVPADDTSAASGGQGGAGGGSAAASLNGCDLASAEDHTADAAVTIATVGFGYSPACLRVKAGTTVTWNSNFAVHPLRAGDAATRAEDPSSPIQPTDSGTSAAFAFPSAGAFGFYCNIHAPSMAGAVFVE